MGEKSTAPERDTGQHRAVRGTRATVCRCGQQLDCCTRQHCPRCGRSLTRG